MRKPMKMDLPRRKAAVDMVAGRYGAAPEKGPGVRAGLRHPVSQVLVSVSPAKVSAVGKALKAKVPQPGQMVDAGAMRLVWCGPGQFLCISADAGLLADIEKRVGGLAMVADQSHGRVMFSLSGREVLMLFAKGGSSQDFHPSAFPVGSVAATTMAHCPVLVMHARAGVYEVSLPRSYAENFREWMEHQALGLGLEVV